MTSNNADEDSEHHAQDKWYNHRPTKLTIAIAGLVVYVFFVLFDVHDTWPWSPLAAVCIGVPVTIAALYLEVFATEAISFHIFLISSMVVLIAGIIVYLFAPWSGPPEVEVIGTLQPGNDPTPPNSCDHAPAGAVAPEALKILIASNGYFRNGFGKIIAIEIGKDPNACQVLTMERTPVGIAVGAELYGEKGQLIARIRNGEFHAISGEHSYVERQGDLSTLIVKSRMTRFLFLTIEKEILYVRYLNPTTIQARGIFGCPGHKPVAFTNYGTIGASLTMMNSCIGTGNVAVHID